MFVFFPRSDQLIIEMLLFISKSLLSGIRLYASLSFTHSCLYLSFESRFPPPFKGFEDLGFAMNPMIHIESQFPAQYFPSADWLHALPIFQLDACRFYGKYKRFDLIS